jgi:hypothetical protein
MDKDLQNTKDRRQSQGNLKVEEEDIRPND